MKKPPFLGGLALLALILSLASGACQPSRSDIEVEIIGPELELEDPSDYGGQAYSHTGSIVLHGDSADIAAPVLAVLRVERISGGDPEFPRPDGAFVVQLVENGAGSFDIFGGMRSRDDAWAFEQIRLTVVGILPVRPASQRR